jgi:membrane-associated protease RseP (regulator of RpoE activity)
MLGVLGIHELGHYAAARYHGVDVTLPYFIPFPSLLGTMGAVINIRSRIPSRRALFDIGVAGPLAGLVATVVVTVVGLSLDPISVPARVTENAGGYAITFQDPLLLQALEFLVRTAGLGTTVGPGEAIHPIVFAGWAGMFFTFLNLLPVGQLDGGHLVRAIVGQRQETVAAAVPGGLFALAGFLYLTRDPPPIGFGVWTLWVFWGLFATGLAYAGPAHPTVDESLDRRRVLLGVATFGLGLACFTPVPFEIVAT